MELPQLQPVQSEAEAPPAELAAVWVHKAAKGSDQWVRSCSSHQLRIYRVVPGIFRLCRLCRPVIFIAVSKFVRMTVNRLWRSCLRFWEILAALVVAVLFFVWFAIVMFSRSEEGREHFQDWPEALASLWVLFTTANFPDVMIQSYTETRASFFFFFVYLVICLYLLQNVLLAAVYDAYKDQLKRQLCKKTYSIKQAFEVLALKSAIGVPVITLERWVDFYTAYGQMLCDKSARWHCLPRIFLHFMFEKDKAYVQQQAHRTFKAMDADGNGYIEQKEFCMVVEVLSNPRIYIPMRPVPSMARSRLGKGLVHLFMSGVRVADSRYSWRAIMDIVVLIEVLLALGQTIVFVSPRWGGKFRDAPLRPPSFWFKSLMATTVFFAGQILIQMLVIGPARFWNRLPYRHRFDGLTISVLLTMQLAAIFCDHAPDWLVRTVLVIHIARAICLMWYIEPFRYLTALLARLLPVYYRLGLLLLMVFYIFTSIGDSQLKEQLFGGRMLPAQLKGSGYAEDQYWPLNFDDFPSGLVTLFSVMVVNNWFVLAGGFMQVTTPYASIFFVSFFVIVNLVVLNILIALIIDTSAVVREEIEEKQLSFTR
eukprot:g22574.t1